MDNIVFSSCLRDMASNDNINASSASIIAKTDNQRKSRVTISTRKLSSERSTETRPTNANTADKKSTIRLVSPGSTADTAKTSDTVDTDSKKKWQTSSDNRHSSRPRSRYTIHGRLDRSGSADEQLYMPTYRMESQRPFNLEHMNFIVVNSVRSAIRDPLMATYDPARAMKCCENIANEIRFRIKMHQYDRYRIIVLVNIFEKWNQGIHCKMGFLWDTQADQWLSHQQETKHFTVTAVVLAVYWEWPISSAASWVSVSYPGRRPGVHPNNQHKTFLHTAPHWCSFVRANRCNRMYLKAKRYKLNNVKSIKQTRVSFIAHLWSERWRFVE